MAEAEEWGSLGPIGRSTLRCCCLLLLLLPFAGRACRAACVAAGVEMVVIKGGGYVDTTYLYPL